MLARGIPDIEPDKGYAFYEKKGQRMYGERNVNVSLSTLYKIAFGANYQALIELDSFPIDQFRPKQKNLDDSNTYYLEITGNIPAKSERDKVVKEAIIILRKILEEVFGITAMREMRSVTGFILNEKPENYKFKSVNDDTAMVVRDIAMSHMIVKNMPSKDFAYSVEYYLRNTEILHFFNEMSYQGKVSLDISAQINKYDEMRDALPEYGLELSIGQREKKFGS